MGLFRVAGEIRTRSSPRSTTAAPALVLYLGDSFEGVFMFEVTDGRITHLYAMRNPDKLAGIDIQRRVSR